MIRGSRWTTALMACALLAGRAIAEPKPPTEKDKQIASDLVKKAIGRSQLGDHGAAIDIYLQAYTIVPNATLLSNLGSEYQQWGKPKEALTYFCMYLKNEPSGANAPYATSQAKLLRSQLGSKDVDDEDVCSTPKPPRKPRVQPVTEDQPVPARPATRDPGPDEIEGTTSQPTGSSLRVPALATSIGGALVLGFGVFAGVQAQTISDEISKHPMNQAWANDIRTLQARGQTWENVQIGTLIGGGVLLTTGVILFLVDGADNRPRDRATLRITPTTNGMAVFGQF
jgi:hypothetical protein